jgi:hypothetical protein
MTLHLIPLNFLIYEKNFIFFFISVRVGIKEEGKDGEANRATGRTICIMWATEKSKEDKIIVMYQILNIV